MDLFFNVVIIDVVVGLFLQQVVFVPYDLDLGLYLLYLPHVNLTALTSLANQVPVEIVFLHLLPLIE